jgi:hypothetical protein
MSLCTKHGKERDVKCTSKPSKRGGTTIDYLGCADCALGLPPSNPDYKPHKKKFSPAAKLDKKNKSAKPAPAPPAPPAPPATVPAKKGSMSERFGFKF